MSQTYSFTGIFSKPVPYSSENNLVTISKIIVPRIQRNYAQGRNGENETKIRENFLREIFQKPCREHGHGHELHVWSSQEKQGE